MWTGECIESRRSNFVKNQRAFGKGTVWPFCSLKYYNFSQYMCKLISAVVLSQLRDCEHDHCGRPDGQHRGGGDGGRPVSVLRGEALVGRSPRHNPL